MPRRQLLIEIPALGAIDRTRGGIGRQLAEVLRNAISGGKLACCGTTSIHEGAGRILGVFTVNATEAYEQLIAEGCLDAHPGASTRVAATLHEPNLAAQRSSASEHRRHAIGCLLPPHTMPLSPSNPAPLPSKPFSVAVPEGAVAMDDHWRRLSNRVRVSQVAAPSGYSEPGGSLCLREAIAEYSPKGSCRLLQPGEHHHHRRYAAGTLPGCPRLAVTRRCRLDRGTPPTPG